MKSVTIVKTKRGFVITQENKSCAFFDEDSKVYEKTDSEFWTDLEGVVRDWQDEKIVSS